MEIIRYGDIAAYLRTGREIEFGYRGKMYSITNAADGYWYFCRDTAPTTAARLCASEKRELLALKAAEIQIDGTSIAGIFDRLLYDAGSLCIL